MLAAQVCTLHGHDDLSDDDPFNRFKSIEDSCLRSLWSSQKLVFASQQTQVPAVKAEVYLREYVQDPYHSAP